MAANTPLQTVGRRYLLHEQLGAGGMGAVYRATDRLTGEAVALKRVTTPTEQLGFASPGGKTNPPLALAQEFSTLASLHHPNIIRVLDYGFDESRCPFFTMTLLENAQTIVEAGQGNGMSVQVNLLVQTLQALAYLHRRGVLHRDLKPGNVLVIPAHKQVKVLDFGVSVITSRTVGYLTQTTVGTLTYMAPEIFQGAPVTRSSDLYAVGVMAYELLAGRFPYNDANAAVLLNDILYKPVDVQTIGVGVPLARVLERLLVKASRERYGDAGEVIRDLCSATGCPFPAETVEIRESFLQAAKFVGREEELGKLSEALEAAQEGRGSAWLVGGESGVGKSRLTDELRTLALVGGTLVLPGQAASEKGGPYHLWRDVLRRLALTADLEGDEASILKGLVPDIGTMVACEVPDAPSLDPEGTQSRLFRTVVEIVRRLCRSRTVVMFLEDLQWGGSESLALLDRLTQGATEISLLLIATYRDDERPHLPNELPGMRVLKLERLSERGITELSESMLGTAGREPRVIDLLQRETEGNPFFLVEVARALAEQAGRLADIARVDLPERVFAGGIQEVIQRRLDQVPGDAQSLLHVAAVAGREIDLSLLRALAPKANLGRWLAACADVAVLEVRSGQWRFVHHGLRDGILDKLTEGVRPELHRQVAEATERIYPDASQQVAALAYHWEQAGEAGRAVAYLRRAGAQAAAQFANLEAVDYIRRALELTPQEDLAERYALLVAREKAYDLMGEREAQNRDLEELEAIADALEDDGRRVAVALRRTHYAWITGDYQKAIEAIRGAIGLIQAAPRSGPRWVEYEAEGYRYWGTLLLLQGEQEEAWKRLEQALALARGALLSRLEADILISLSSVARRQYGRAKARTFCRQALHIYREVGDRRGENRVLNYLGAYSDMEGDYAEARTCYEQALRTSREMGDRPSESMVLINLGWTCALQGDLDHARAHYEQALRICREARIRAREETVLGNLSLLYHQLENHHTAYEYAQQELLVAQDLGSQSRQGYAFTNQGHALAGLSRLSEAAKAYQKALALRRTLGASGLAIESLAGLARVSLGQGDLPQALAHTEEILSYLETDPTLQDVEEPLRVYLTCYRALEASDDARAKAILKTAYDLLQERAAHIDDENLRRSFLENVSYHREIVGEYRRRKGTNNPE